jgi:hypothetical protein
MDGLGMAVEQIGDRGLWGVKWTLEKFDADLDDYLREFGHGVEAYERFHRENSPYERRVIEGNLLVNNGIQLMLDALTGTAITAFSNANARIGVGDSTTAAAASQTDLQAATNKLRKVMDATFPSRAAQTTSWKSSFTSAEANFAWQEWAIFNAASGATSMLNRKVESLGTKSTGTWTLQGDVTIT